MEIKVFNSLTNKVEVFKPIKEGEVTCYVCGPTVYNYAHIGNMRPVVTFDLLRRLFIRLGYKVTFISNFTDIDDKVIKQAQEEKISELEIAEKYISAFERDREHIHSLKPTYQPRVTQTMDEIINFVDALEKKGYAYENEGDVFFRVDKILDYGILSNMKKDDLIVGARIDENSKKESPLDFALWKKTNEGIQFKSPWSMGRPGWHTECVVMINKLVPGGKIDIHGGGFDLKFPHHENEIAQEEAFYGHKIANYWMHNGFINVNNVKMSKSLNNTLLAKDLIEEFGGNAVRFVLINTYYRSPCNFSSDLLEGAKKELDKIYKTYSSLGIKLQLNDRSIEEYQGELDDEVFIKAMADDLNTPNALTELYRLLKEINVSLRGQLDLDKLEKQFFTLKDELWVLGLDFNVPTLSSEDKELFREFDEARKNKDFAKSDEIRQILMKKELM